MSKVGDAKEKAGLGNRLYLFNALSKSKSEKIQELRAQTLAHPCLHVVNKATLYAYIYQHHPASSGYKQPIRKSQHARHIVCLYEMLDVLDTILYGKTGERSA